VIDDQVDWAQRVDLGWITTEALHGITHGSEINNCGHAREILENNSRWQERNFDIVLRRVNPVKDLLNVGFFDTEVVTVADC